MGIEKMYDIVGDEKGNADTTVRMTRVRNTIPISHSVEKPPHMPILPELETEDEPKSAPAKKGSIGKVLAGVAAFGIGLGVAQQTGTESPKFVENAPAAVAPATPEQIESSRDSLVSARQKKTKFLQIIDNHKEWQEKHGNPVDPAVGIAESNIQSEIDDINRKLNDLESQK